MLSLLLHSTYYIGIHCFNFKGGVGGCHTKTVHVCDTLYMGGFAIPFIVSRGCGATSRRSYPWDCPPCFSSVCPCYQWRANLAPLIIPPLLLNIIITLALTTPAVPNINDSVSCYYSIYRAVFRGGFRPCISGFPVFYTALSGQWQGMTSGGVSVLLNKIQQQAICNKKSPNLIIGALYICGGVLQV